MTLGKKELPHHNDTEMLIVSSEDAPGSISEACSRESPAPTLEWTTVALLLSLTFASF